MSYSKNIDGWATYLKSYNRLSQKMEEKLKDLGHPQLEVYDVLWTLEQASECSLRFKELGKKVFLTRYGITRLVDRLVEQGLVERKVCESDKRGVWARLTSQGKKVRQSMWKDYAIIIKNDFSNKLTQKDHQDLIRILSKVWQED
jgi:DNA-binding MarR family transcriptional regulator